MESPRVGRFAALMDRWRQSRGLNNRQFAASLGRSKSGWSHIQHGDRGITPLLAAHVLATAEEPWRSAFERAYLDDLAADRTAHTPEG